MYTVISFHTILKEHIEDYIENMRICAKHSAAEPGCIRYEVLQDIDDPSVFCLTQVFRDEEAYRDHQVAEHHTHWMNISAGWRDVSKHVRTSSTSSPRSLNEGAACGGRRRARQVNPQF